MKNSIKLVTFIWVSFVCLFMLNGCQVEENANQEQRSKSNTDSSYIKSVHYFSSAWPKTFWQNFEKQYVAEELAQIKADGFNTIVLTVPWRGFEINFKKDKTTSVVAMYERLAFLLAQITDFDLQFMLRLGYPHDFSPTVDAGITELCRGMYTDEKTRQQWLDYLNKLKNTVAPYQSHSVGMMISWEDFWCPHFVFTELPEDERLSLAQAMEYSDWLNSANNQPNQVKTLLGVNQITSANTTIPRKTDQSYVLFLDFVDQKLDDILELTRQVFPGTVLEVRVDKDPVKVGDDIIWVGHDLYLDNDEHRATYWAPFWGAKNQGELLSADEALSKFNYFLNYVTGDGENINHVIEQFNFTDNTPYFPNNANIEPDEVNEFLTKAAPLLKEKSIGYGLWAYRDYADNLFYNAYFEQGLHGWQHNEHVEIENIGNDNYVHIKDDGYIEQAMRISDRVMWAVSYDHMNFCYQGHKAGELVISVNQEAVTQLKTQTGQHCHQIPAQLFKQHLEGTIRIQALSEVIMDEIKIFGFIQKLGVYDHFGQPGPYLEGVRQLNKEL